MISTLVNEDKKEIFLITKRQSGNISLNLLKNTSFISKVRIDSPNIIKQMNENFLSSYECEAYDLYICN